MLGRGLLVSERLSTCTFPCGMGEAPRLNGSERTRKASNRQDYGYSLNGKMVYLHARVGYAPTPLIEQDRLVAPTMTVPCSLWQVKSRLSRPSPAYLQETSV